MQNEFNTTSRRDLLKGVIAAGVATGASSILKGAQNDVPNATASTAEKTVSAGGSDLIRTENSKSGTSDWLLINNSIEKDSKYPAYNPTHNYRCSQIEGYCSHTSLRAGEKLAIMVSTNPSTSYRIDIYRLGYYGGLGARSMEMLGPFQGKTQLDPNIGIERLRECNWEPAVEFTIPTDWPSGVYLGKLTTDRDGAQSYVIFIVRDDRPCDFLFQCSDATWSAYNRWPNQYSMYDSGSNPWYCGPGVRVSWDRPYGKYCQVVDAPLSQGSGEFLLWEFPLAFWMEKQGYDVSYISNVDTHADAQRLLRTKAFLSVGHDEYWSRAMYDNVQGAIADGVNVAFLSGNTCWGLISFFPRSQGESHRAISRIGQFGELEQEMVARYPELGLFKEFAPSEGNMIGGRNIFPGMGISDWFCTDENHWIFAGTGMKNGDGIKNLVGWEWNGKPSDIPGLHVVSRGLVKVDEDQGEYASTIYPGPKNNWVFNAGTIWWTSGLSAPPGYKIPFVYGGSPSGPDSRVQQITKNLFDRFCGRS